MGVRGMGRLFLRGDIWWLEHKDNGKTVRDSSAIRPEGAIRGGRLNPRTGKKDPPPEAELWRMDMITKQKRGEPMRAEQLKFDAVADALEAEYRVMKPKSYPRLRMRLRPLRATFTGWRVLDMSYSRLIEYIEERYKAGAKPATVALEVTFLAKAFRLAKANRLIADAPQVPMINKRLFGKRQGGIPDDQLVRALDVMSPVHHAAPVWFLRLSGWRRDEGLRLEWVDVDWKAEEVLFFVMVENNKQFSRAIPWSKYPQLKHLLVCQRAHCRLLEAQLGKEIPWVFPDDKGERITGDALFEAWDRARTKAELPDIKQRDGVVRPPTLHDLRRTVSGLSNSVAPGRGWDSGRHLLGHPSNNPEVHGNYTLIERDQLESVTSSMSERTAIVSQFVPKAEIA